MDKLSQRDLNRATLARQYLLDRGAASALDTIEHLGGMQAQAPLAPYIGLWTRLGAFGVEDLSALIEDRRVVRLHMMRNTLHLGSARDCLDWRSTFSQRHAADFQSHFSGSLQGVDRRALLEDARRLLDERPLTRAQLGRVLAEQWPDADPGALGYAATHLLALCQVPPRGVWGRPSGPAAWTPLESWLGDTLRARPVDGLVGRYLGAFGPATTADVQLWSGLTRLREVVERLPLRTFVGPDGQTLYDLPAADRPSGDLPAPPRLLPAYDNLLLSHHDRSRMMLTKRPVPLPAGNGSSEGTFLVDGTWQGTWRLLGNTMRLRSFDPLGMGDRNDLLSEAKRLLSFLGADEECDLILEQ